MITVSSAPADLAAHEKPCSGQVTVLLLFAAPFFPAGPYTGVETTWRSRLLDHRKRDRKLICRRRSATPLGRMMELDRHRSADGLSQRVRSRVCIMLASLLVISIGQLRADPAYKVGGGKASFSVGSNVLVVGGGRGREEEGGGRRGVVIWSSTQKR